MNLKDIKIKDLLEEQDVSQNKPSGKSKDDGRLMGQLGGIATSFLPLIPARYKAIIGLSVFFMAYGVGAFVYTIVQLLKLI